MEALRYPATACVLVCTLRSTPLALLVHCPAGVAMAQMAVWVNKHSDYQRNQWVNMNFGSPGRIRTSDQRDRPMKSIIPPRLEAVIRSRLGASAPPPEDPRWQADGRDPSEIRGARSHPRRRRKNDPRASCVLSDAEITRAHARYWRENHVDAPCVMLPDAEIVRTLMRYRYDREFRGERRVPIKTLAVCVGLSHETLYQAMKGSISERTAAKLSWAIVANAAGQLRFRRRGQRWVRELDAGSFTALAAKRV
jgi:hypothetical protein